MFEFNHGVSGKPMTLYTVKDLTDGTEIVFSKLQSARAHARTLRRHNRGCVIVERLAGFDAAKESKLPSAAISIVEVNRPKLSREELIAQMLGEIPPPPFKNPEFPVVVRRKAQ